MVPEDKRICPTCGDAGRPLPRRPARAAPRASARSAATRSRSRPSCSAGRPRRRPVRGRRVPRPRRPRLDLPRPRPQRLRPLGRAQGPAQLRRPRRARRGDRRAAVPRPGRAPAHRRDLQLRDARGRRLHRHGVRRRHVAQAAAQGADARHRRRATTRSRSTRRSPTSSRSCPRSSTCTTSACSTATSSPTTSSRSATRSSSSTSAACAASTTTTPRSTARRATRRPRCRRSARRSRPTSTRSAARCRARHGVPRLPEHLRRVAAAGRPTRRCSSSTTRCYRLLLKACAPDPDDRFVSADELRVQLLGVLREVVAAPRREGRGASTRRRRCSSTSPTVADDPSTGRTSRACARTTATRRPLAARPSASTTPPAPGRAARRPGDQPRGAPRPGARRARGRAARPGRRRGHGAARRRPVGVARGLDVGPGRPRARGRRPRRRARSTPSTARCPASWRPSSRSPSPARRGGETDVAESLYMACARTDANYIAPAAFGLARIRAGRGDVAGAVRALDLVPVDEPGVHARPDAAGPGCSPGRAAGCRRWPPPSTASRA